MCIVHVTTSLLKVKRIINSPVFWGILIGILLCFLAAHWLDTHAQNVVLRGDTFICVDSVKSNPTMTKYFYLTKDGKKYPIYATANGKCFVVKISKKGKEYKQYLPQISEKLYGKNSKQSR